MASSKSRFLADLVTRARELSPILLEHNPPFWSHASTVSSSEEYVKACTTLRNMVSQLSVEGIGVESLPDEALWNAGRYGLDPNKPEPPAPCAYTGIFETVQLNLCMFTLRDVGCEIPLHDHPGIHGFLKVIRGRVRVSQYSWPDAATTSRLQLSADDLAKFADQSESESVPLSPRLRQKFSMVKKRPLAENRLAEPVLFEGDVELGPDDPAAFLTPAGGNVHRVMAVTPMSTIIDLLVPNYDAPSRDCHYFQVVPSPYPKWTGPDTDEGRKVRWLRRIDWPQTYFCDNVPYLGSLDWLTAL